MMYKEWSTPFLKVRQSNCNKYLLTTLNVIFPWQMVCVSHPLTHICIPESGQSLALVLMPCGKARPCKVLIHLECAHLLHLYTSILLMHYRLHILPIWISIGNCMTPKCGLITLFMVEYENHRNLPLPHHCLSHSPMKKLGFGDGSIRY